MSHSPPRTIVTVALLGVFLLSCKEQTGPRVGPAAHLDIHQGDDQVSSVSSVVQLSVRVTDEAGRPVPGERVFWTIDQGTGTVTAESSTNSSGVATAQRTLGQQAGFNKTRARIQQATVPFVVFNSVALVQGGMRMHALGSTTLSDTVLATLAPWEVMVRDHKDAPVAGVEVRWRVVPSSGTLLFPSATTDANGVARAVQRLASVRLTTRVEAYVDGLSGSPVQFTAEAAAGSPMRVTVVSGDQQVGLPDVALAGDYVVAVTDAYGNIRPDDVSWSVVSGQGFVIALHPGVARHKLGPSDGPQSVLAQVQGHPELNATFTSTAVSSLVAIRSTTVSGPNGFFPANVTIAAGHAVGWQWEINAYCFYYRDCQEHNIAFEDDPSFPTSTPTRREGSHARVFSTPGVYRYRCTNHSTDFTHGMVGTVIVNGAANSRVSRRTRRS